MLTVLVPALGLLASACTQGDARAADSQTTLEPLTIPVSPLPASTRAAEPSTTAAETTAAPLVSTTTTAEPATTIVTTTAIPAETTTIAPTTEAAPATADPALTTTAPTTEAPPPTVEASATIAAEPTTTVVATVPSNVELVDPFPQQLEAVGGRSGEATKWVQMRLIQLGFWNSAADGQFGLTTKQAVMAFQKYIGLPASGSVDEATAAYLTNMTERAHGLTNSGDLIEIDKQKQLLFIVRGGKTLWVLNTSTGNGLPYEEEDKNSPGEIQTGVSITSDGLWKVNRERPEGWWEGDLGEIYRPKYFHGGQAVHGSTSVPNYPASHGCVRVTVQAMDWIWDNDLMPMGIPVWVHGG